MNRTRKRCHAALGLLLWLQVSAGGHVGERLYPIPYLSDEMLAEVQLDGRIEEWYELLGEPAMASLDFRKIGEEEPPDPASLDFRIWLGWHDDPARFYVAFVASDDVYKNTHDWSVDSRAYVGFHDSIELAVDGDHSGGRRCRGNCSEEEGLELRGQTQRYGAIARTASGPTMRGGFAWMAMPPYMGRQEEA